MIHRPSSAIKSPRRLKTAYANYEKNMALARNSSRSTIPNLPLPFTFSPVGLVHIFT